MKILVTGGCGFIGANYIAYLLQSTDHEVINIDALTYAGDITSLQAFVDNPRYQFYEGDICDAELVDGLVAAADCIVHFAAESHVDRSIKDAAAFAATNVIGTLTLLDAAVRNGKKRFHHISTDEVFGSLGDSGQFSESTAYDPRSPYSASKAASDHFVRAYFHTHGLPVTISNCSNNYGPYQHPEKFIPKSITDVLVDRPITLYGTGLNVRDWLYVSDHVEAIQLIVEQGTIGETYCVGGGEQLTNLDLANTILAAMDQPEAEITFVPDRPGHDFRYAIDNTKIAAELDWSPAHSFEQGIRATINWYTENTDWWQPKIIRT